MSREIGQDELVDVEGLIEPVSELIRDVAKSEVLSRFRRLGSGDVGGKAGDEPVTIADREAELALFRGLGGLMSDAMLIGEEAVAEDPSLLHRARQARSTFVVDPIDGTRNFIAGSPDFAVMVAFVVDGGTVASWIHQPVHDRLYTAVAGGGARVNGRELVRRTTTRPVDELTGVLRTWALGPESGETVWRRAAAFGSVGEGRLAAGIEYPRIVEGEIDFVLWWRTRVWDHAPGALLLAETGGLAGRLDGTPYRPRGEREGLIAASTPEGHRRVRDVLAPGGRV